MVLILCCGCHDIIVHFVFSLSKTWTSFSVTVVQLVGLQLLLMALKNVDRSVERWQRYQIVRETQTSDQETLRKKALSGIRSYLCHYLERQCLCQ